MTHGKSQANGFSQGETQGFNDRTGNEGPLRTISETNSNVHSAPGFLGSTSYSAVFTEGESHVNLESEAQAQHSHLPSEQLNAVAVDSSIVREGSQILALLQNPLQYRKAADRWSQTVCLCDLNPFVQECVDVVTMGDIFRGLDLIRVSQTIFERTALPFDVKNIRSVSQISTFFMGDHLSWEIVGLVLMAAGLGAISLDEISLNSDDEGCNWKDLAKTWLHAADRCKYFCQEFGQLNDFAMLQILFNHILHTQVYGDAGKQGFQHVCNG